MANENFADPFLGVSISSFRPLIRFGDSLTYVDTVMYSMNIEDIENRNNIISTSKRVANFIDSKSEVFNNIVDRYWKDMLWTTSSASYENYKIESGNYNYKNRRMLFRLNSNIYLDTTPDVVFDFDTNKQITFDTLVYTTPVLKSNTNTTINNDPTFTCPIYWQFSNDSALSNLKANFSEYSEQTLNLNFKQNDWASYHVDLNDNVKLDISCEAQDVTGNIVFGSTSDSVYLQEGHNELTTSLTDGVVSFSNVYDNEQIHRAKVTDCNVVVNDLIEYVSCSRDEVLLAHPFNEYILPEQHTTPLTSIDTVLTMSRLFQPEDRDWEIALTYQPVTDTNTYSLVKTDSYRVVNNVNMPLFDIHLYNGYLEFYVYGVNPYNSYIQFYHPTNTDKITVKLSYHAGTIRFYIKEKYDLQFKLISFYQCGRVVDNTDGSEYNLSEALQNQDNHLIFNENNRPGLITDVKATFDGKTFADMTNVSLDYGVTVSDWGSSNYQIAAFTADLSSHKIYTDYITSVETPTETSGVLWFDWNSKTYKEYLNNAWTTVDYIPAVIRSVDNGVTTISYSDWSSYKNTNVLTITANDIITAGLYRLYWENYSQDGLVTFEFGENKLELETTPQLNYIDFQHDLRVGEKTIKIKADGYIEIDCSALRLVPLSEVPNSNFDNIPAFTSNWTKYYQNTDEQVSVHFNNIANSDTLTCYCKTTGDFDVCVDSMFGTTLGTYPNFKWDLTYGTQTKSIYNCLSNYNCNSFLVPFSSDSTVKNIDINIDTASTSIASGRFNNLSVYQAMVRNGAFSKISDWYSEGSGFIDVALCCATATGVYKLYQAFDTSSLDTDDELFVYANIDTLQSNQQVKIYLKDQVSEHEVTLLDTSVNTITSNDHNQYIVKATYDGDPIVANPLYLGAYTLNVTLTDLNQDDFILFDLTKTVWVRQNKQWVDTNEVYDTTYGSTSYPTIISHINEQYIGAYEDPSELPETTDIGNFAYVFVSIYVYQENGWVNVGYITAQEDNYPRYTETTNPHYKGNGVVKVMSGGSIADFTNVYTNQFMDLDLNNTEFKYNGTKWIDTTNRIGTTPHNVDSNYQLIVDFIGSGISASQPVSLNSLSIQKTDAEPLYTAKNFKDVFSWNKNVFENNHLTFTGSGNEEIKLINYVLKPYIEYSIGFNYSNSYGVGRIRFKFVTSDNSIYTTTDWLTLGSVSSGTGKIAYGVLKLVAPNVESRLVIEPDSYFIGNIDDLNVVVSNYLTVPSDIVSQSWQTLNDNYLPVFNKRWIIQNNTLKTNGSITAYSSDNKQSAAVCFLDSIVYNNTVNISITVDALSGGQLAIKSGDETNQYVITSTGTFSFDLGLGESSSILVATVGTLTSATISNFEVKLKSGTIQLNQDGYLNDGTVQYTSATTFNVSGSSVGSDIKGQQNRAIELFQNDSDSTTDGTFIKGFYNSRTNQIEAIEWRQDGYITDSALISYITSGRQTLNSTLLNQVFFDANRTLYVSTERVIEQALQPDLKNNQVWYDTVNRKYFIEVSNQLIQVQYLGYCATDSNKIVICRGRQNRRKLSNPVKPYISNNTTALVVGADNMLSQNTWKKFLTDQNSYWHSRIFADTTTNNSSSSDSLINVLIRSIPDNYNAAYENWMDAGEIYYIGQNDYSRNVYWDHETQCYRWKANGDIVLAQVQKDANNQWFYHNLYSDYTIIDKSMVLRRTAWKNENCNAQIYLIGGAGGLTTNQTAVASSSYTEISTLNCKAYSGGICVGGAVDAGIYSGYAGLYQANSGKDMPLNVTIRIPNTESSGWTALSTLPYGCSGTFTNANILTSTESKCCRPSGGVVYAEEYLRRLIGSTITVATGTSSNINGKVNKGNDGAVIIIEKWNS